MNIKNISDTLSRNSSFLKKEILRRQNELLTGRDEKNTKVPHHKLFEHKVWLLFEGFKNKVKFFNGPETKISWLEGGNGETQQIDGFFVVDNVVFICEATTQESLGDKIDDFAFWKSKLIDNGIENFISSEPSINFKDMNIVWLLFSKNETSPKNEKKAQKHDINIIYDNDISYMNEVLLRYSKQGMYDIAFTSFIATVLQLKIPSKNDIVLPAIRYNYNQTDPNAFCYSVICHPIQVLDRCLVVHRRSDKQQDSYQRFIDNKKLDEVSKFIQRGNNFANNIILCSSTLESNGMYADGAFNKFDKQVDKSKLSTIEESLKPVVGSLKLPKWLGDISIIDGQHRLLGYYNNSNNTKDFVNLIIFNSSLIEKEQMILFKDINEKQKGLDPNHIWELYENTLEKSDIKQNVSEFFNKYLYDDSEEFALFGKITLQNQTEALKRGKGKRLSLVNLCQELTRYRRERDEPVIFAYLQDLYPESKSDPRDYTNISLLLNSYFNVFKKDCPEDFEINSSGIVMSAFCRGFLKIFREILYEWKVNGTLQDIISRKSLLSGKTENEFRRFLSPVTKSINNFVKEYPDESDRRKAIQKFKREMADYGGGAPKQAASYYAKIISNKHKGFGKNLILDNDNEPWFKALKEVIDAKDETDFLEVKTEIFFDAHKERNVKEKIASSDILHAVAGFYHLNGGYILVGLNDDYEVVGCEKELYHYAEGGSLEKGFGRWKDAIIGIVRECSKGKIRTLDFERTEIEGKQVILISIPKMSDQDLKEQEFVEWTPRKSNEEKRYIRFNDSTRTFKGAKMRARDVVKYSLENRQKYSILDSFEELIDISEESGQSIPSLFKQYRIKT